MVLTGRMRIGKLSTYFAGQFLGVFVAAAILFLLFVAT